MCAIPTDLSCSASPHLASRACSSLVHGTTIRSTPNTDELSGLPRPALFTDIGFGLANDQYYPYYFIVDDTYRVGDPYAHLVLDPYNDRYLAADVWPDRPQYPSEIQGVMLGVYRGDIDDYNFSDFTIPAHDNLIVYEMLFGDFTGTDGLNEGNGTVAKAIEKIPYIKSLGFNAVELMPIMEFNGNNSWGYNTNFYMAPDKAYGSPRDYKDFIEACHGEGIAVILDIVFNRATVCTLGIRCTLSTQTHSTIRPRPTPTTYSTTGTKVIRSFSSSGPTHSNTGWKNTTSTVSASTS